MIDSIRAEVSGLRVENSDELERYKAAASELEGTKERVVQVSDV